MRTTVVINDALARKVRALMRKRQTTLRALIEEGLGRVVAASDAPQQFKLRDASAGTGGLAEGVEDMSWEIFSRFLYPES